MISSLKINETEIKTHSHKNTFLKPVSLSNRSYWGGTSTQNVFQFSLRAAALTDVKINPEVRCALFFLFFIGMNLAILFKPLVKHM